MMGMDFSLWGWAYPLYLDTFKAALLRLMESKPSLAQRCKMSVTGLNGGGWWNKSQDVYDVNGVSCICVELVYIYTCEWLVLSMYIYRMV